MEKRISTKVKTGKVRFAYVNVWEPKTVDGGDEKYSISLIIPKSDTKTISDINAAIEQAIRNGMRKFGGGVPEGLMLPLRDGDIDRPYEEAYKNAYFLNATSKEKPEVVNRYVFPILERSEFYSGCYGRATMNFYAYNVNGNAGIACGLGNLQKLSDGEPLSYRTTAEKDFEAEYDDDLDSEFYEDFL